MATATLPQPTRPKTRPAQDRREPANVLRLERRAFRRVASLVRSITPRRGKTPITKTGYLYRRAGQHWICARDGDVSQALHARLPVLQGHIDGPAVLPVRELDKLLRRMKGIDEVRLALSDGTVTLQFDGGRYEMRCMDPDDFPFLDWDEADQRPAAVLKTSFLQETKTFTQACVSSDWIRPLFHYVQLDPASTAPYLGTTPTPVLVGTDGHRLAMDPVTQERGQVMTDKPVYLPKILWKLTRRLRSTDVKLYHMGERIVVAAGDIVVIGGKIAPDEKYPAYEKVFPTSPTMTATLDADPFMQACERLLVVASSMTNQSRWHFSEDGARLLSKDIERKRLGKEALPCEIEGDDDEIDEGFEIGFNLVYAADLLRAFKGKRVSFSLTAATKAVVVQEADKPEGAGSVALLMPVMLDTYA